ncbi:MAG: twin-arginine translocation signal domain-containing protein, partial [Terriglobia bacterium]
MNRRDFLYALGATGTALRAGPRKMSGPLSLASSRARLHLSCGPENDLYQVLGASGISTMRYSGPGQAVNQVPRG